jgi:hypothetical protein
MDNSMDVGKDKYLKIVSESNRLNKIIAILHQIDNENLFLTGGSLRNIIWNKLHNFKENFQLEDCDIIFYNNLNTSKQYEIELNNMLKNVCSDINWSVKNQARMHIKNKHTQYNGIFDALSLFPDTSSAIAIDKNYNIVAPFDFIDILNLTLKPTDYCKKNEFQIFENRITSKKWLTYWDKLYSEQIYFTQHSIYEKGG